jgi:hypothetical protein
MFEVRRGHATQTIRDSHEMDLITGLLLLLVTSGSASGGEPVQIVLQWRMEEIAQWPDHDLWVA